MRAAAIAAAWILSAGVELLGQVVVRKPITHIPPPGRSGSAIGTGTIQEDPAKVREQIRRRCLEEIAEARVHIAGAEWGKAREKLEGAQMLVVDQECATEIVTLYRQVGAEGQRQKDEADKLYNQGQYLTALKLYRRISNEFGPLPAARAAREAMRQAESDPAAQTAVQEAGAQGLNEVADKVIEGRLKALARAASGPASAPGLPSETASRTQRLMSLPVDEQAKVIDLLERIVKLYPLAPTGQRAAADLETLRADAALMSAIAAHRQADAARAALERAEVYRKSGLTAKAIQYYREVIEKFPGTGEAAQARLAIAALEVEALAR